MTQFHATVFIGRFQPVHQGHLHTIKLALQHSETLILILGSHNSPPSLRNPWSSTLRKKMIQTCLTEQEKKRIVFLPIRDRLYNESVWIQNIQQEVHEILRKQGKKDPHIALIGHNKDATSYYLKQFPTWHFLETGNFENINSTEIRTCYFSKDDKNLAAKKGKEIPISIFRWLESNKKSKAFLALQEEYQTVKKHKPQKISMATASCLVRCGNYILLTKKQSAPGKGLWSLPEDFFPEGENPKKWSLTFLEQMTSWKPDNVTEKKYFSSHRQMNYPQRNPYETKENHVFYYNLPPFLCPPISKGLNVQNAKWISLDDFPTLETKLTSDHFQIIQCFLERISCESCP